MSVRLVAGSLIALFVFGFASAAWAHDVRPGAVAMREIAEGEFAVVITPAEDGAGRLIRPEPVWPACRVEGLRVHCAANAAIDVEMPGLAAQRVKVVVTLNRLDGSWAECVLREEETLCRLDVAPTGWEVFAGYTRSGAEHFVGGADHVLFVGALLLLIGFRRALIFAVTGFTLGHSLSLGLASIGMASLNMVVVEILIAASVAHLAREALVRGESWTVRFPATVSTAFGLLHGLGFASVLQEYGLPETHQLAALAAFNVGLELAQLALIAAFGALSAIAARIVRPRLMERSAQVMAYAIGAVAVYWTLERALAWAFV